MTFLHNKLVVKKATTGDKKWGGGRNPNKPDSELLFVFFNHHILPKQAKADSLSSVHKTQLASK